MKSSGKEIAPGLTPKLLLCHVYNQILVGTTVWPTYGTEASKILCKTL